MPCLETDFLVDVIRQRPDALAKLDQLIRQSEPLTVTPVSISELFRGAFKSGEEKNFSIVEEIGPTLKLLEFDWPATRIAGEWLNRLDKKGEPIGLMDTLTAAIALRHNQTTIITKNKKHFQKISGLKIQDW